MSEIAIRVENLGKLYRIGKQEQYKTLRDTIAGMASSPKRLLRRVPIKDDAQDTFWALKNVSFEVKQGDLVGVIGRNGAGKSTLLKILSRITEPTEGRTEIHGRVGSLLEVGTGFHAELSGRENIFLNGAILGMRKAEIARKFDDIVAFSELEKFIDTPVKHYSTGMYMRLAFAVAAHLETEVLLVDEVLAVGDAEFQKKCLGKMEDVSRSGRTVLFVSHTMSAIQRLCTRAILLSRGGIEIDGAVEPAIEHYMASHSEATYTAAPIPGKPTVTFAAAEWLEAECEIKIRAAFESPFPLRPPVLAFTLFDSTGSPVYGTNTRFEWAEGQPEAMDRGEIEIRVAAEALRSGIYRISFWLGDHYQDHDIIAHALAVPVNPGREHPLQPSRSLIGSARLPTAYKYSQDMPVHSLG